MKILLIVSVLLSLVWFVAVMRESQPRMLDVENGTYKYCSLTEQQVFLRADISDPQELPRVEVLVDSVQRLHNPVIKTTEVGLTLERYNSEACYGGISWEHCIPLIEDAGGAGSRISPSCHEVVVRPNVPNWSIVISGGGPLRLFKRLEMMAPVVAYWVLWGMFAVVRRRRTASS